MLLKYRTAFMISTLAFFIGCTKLTTPNSPFQVTCSVVEPGDANKDCKVDFQDALAVFNAGKYANGAVATWADGDFDGDAKISSADLKILTAALYQNRLGDCDGDGIVSYEDLFNLTLNSRLEKKPASKADCDFVGPNGSGPDGVVDENDRIAVMTSGFLTPAPRADLNVDGKVDYLDVIQFYAAGKLGTAKSASSGEGDIDSDGAVDALDLASLPK